MRTKVFPVAYTTPPAVVRTYCYKQSISSTDPTYETGLKTVSITEFVCGCWENTYITPDSWIVIGC